MPLSTDLLNRFVSALVQVPMTATYQGRSSLLGSFQTDSINRDENNRWADLISIIKTLDILGQKKETAELPLIVVAETALDSMRDWNNEIVTALQDVKRDLRLYYAEKKARQAAYNVENNSQPPTLIQATYYNIIPLNTGLNIHVISSTISIPEGYRCLGKVDASPTEQFYRERDGHVAVLVPQSSHASPFLIDKYEITNQQFCLFLNTLLQEHLAQMSVTPREVAIKHAPTGTILARDASVYWKNSRHTHLPRHPWGMEFHQDRWQPCAGSGLLPATLVSWWGALFYAQWVHHLPLSQREVLHLPDQHQWTAAALFDPVMQQTRSYPWGEAWQRQKVNYIGNLIHQDLSPQEDLEAWLSRHAEAIEHIQPLPVGSLPEGCSPTGCHHMLGNVWEWLADAASGSVERRVIKGGSCLLPQDYCQPAYPYDWKAANPNAYIGFRCICPLKG